MNKVFIQVILLSAFVFSCVSVSGVHTNQHKDVLSRNRICKNQGISGELFRRTELFFGSLKPDGSMVTDEEFERFLKSEITPRFQDELTLLVGTGQFKDSKGEIIREKSRLIILIYPFGESESSERIEQIRDAYKSAFGQESVIRADSLSCVSF
ncbi:MAG: DUF3574 domain-containing protein [Candidatus Dadabacteria bacterium]